MIIAVLENIRSAHNVGSIFRSADAFGVSSIYLCGITPTPIDKYGIPRKDILKTSLGAEHNISWKYFNSSLRAVNSLRKKEFKIFSIEQSNESENIKELKKYNSSNIALIFGNEIDGVSAKVLDVSHKVFEIPMVGKKESLNVAVAFGIALYSIKL